MSDTDHPKGQFVGVWPYTSAACAPSRSIVLSSFMVEVAGSVVAPNPTQTPWKIERTGDHLPDACKHSACIDAFSWVTGSFCLSWERASVLP